MTPRLYCPLPLAAGTDVPLPAQAAHHAARVLRLKKGSAVTLFDGGGAEYAARLEGVEGRAVVARIEAMRAVDRESPLDVTLVQGVAAADRMDFAIQKAVELGARAIVPVVAARSVVKLYERRAGKRLEHWRGIVIASCEQCGRNVLPVVAEVSAFSAWVAAPTIAGVRLLLSPDAGDALASLPAPAGAIELLVGPEGGFTPEEEAAALRAGFRAVRAGPRVLRTETAAPAALAAMNALWGDWR